MRTYIADNAAAAAAIGRRLGIRQERDGLLLCEGGEAVCWCAGPLFRIAPPERFLEAGEPEAVPGTGIVFPRRWILEPVEGRGRDILRGALRSALERSDEAVVATAAGREGARKGWEILEALGFGGRRLRLLPEEIEERSGPGLPAARPLAASDPELAAGLARARADWILGTGLSRAAGLAARTSDPVFPDRIAAGRLTAPVLQAVADRDEDVARQRAHPRIIVTAGIRHARGDWTAALIPPGGGFSIGCAEDVERLCSRVELHTGEVTEWFSCEREAPPPPPATAAEAALWAEKKLRLMPEESLRSIASLEKKGLLTRGAPPGLRAPRWEGAQAALSAASEFEPRLRPLLALADFSRRRAGFASFPWREGGLFPTGAAPEEPLAEPEKSLFFFASRLVLAQFFPDCRYRESRARAAIRGFAFEGRTRTLVRAGWAALFDHGLARSDERGLPPMERGDRVTARRLSARFSRGRPLYSSAASVARTLLETSGEPRLAFCEANRAALLLELLREKKLVLRLTSGRYRATDRGRALLAALPEEFREPRFCARFEATLHGIESGRQSETELEQEAKEMVLLAAGQLPRPAPALS
ncbi:DNA topoisomerase [Mesosutterella sp. AGMB02718]|uniref:DNA topoisomerase n=1 Tax=Mesosutterella faecium TaxID=2925194 RepID=A0ABT7IQ04_9BURK|nr:DNA topoisomerase [Mesosutterella sp. AGMB02718]MDL2060045.1 DNA topoisomerase [Mesosutterella sp. AGMB02718]